MQNALGAVLHSISISDLTLSLQTTWKTATVSHHYLLDQKLEGWSALQKVPNGVSIKAAVAQP